MTSHVDGFMEKADLQCEGYVDKVSDGVMIGWARALNSNEPLPISVYSNDTLIASGMADQYREDLERAGKGNGRYAFTISIPRSTPLEGLKVEVTGVGQIPFSFALRAALDSTMSLPIASLVQETSKSDAPFVHEQTVWIDISDFLFYLRHHKTVSGIQRVQCEIIRSILSNKWHRYKFCVTTPECVRYYQVPNNALDTLLARLDVNALVPEAEWVSYVTMIADVARLPPAEIVSGSMLFVLGAFWVFPEIPYLLTALRSKGVRIGVYIYDLIPLYYPEYCDINLIKNFIQTFSLVAQLSDLILTISRHTANEVEQYYHLTKQGAKTIRPVLLAHELRNSGSADSGPSNAANTLRVIESIDGPYVLCVCTIEVRKNHLYLFRIWRELLKKHGRSAIPKLVLVGRRGWRVDDLFAQLEATRYLDGHIKIMSGLDNSELEALYKHCMFTVFPSYNEGWGLPVGESLVYGKLCVASRATSIPEVGNQFSIYIDPDNVSDGLQTIERIIFNRELREEVESTIRSQFVPRSWNEVSATFVQEIQSYLEAAGTATALLPPGRLRCGEIVIMKRVGDLCSTEDVVRQNPENCLICTQGWYPPESWGIWGQGKSNQIAFVLEPGKAPVPERVRVYLKLTLPPWIRNTTLRISNDHGESEEYNFSDKSNYLFSFDCTPVRVAGKPPYVQLTLTLDRDFQPNPPEVRHLGIGIQAIIAVDASDPLQRLDALEKLIAATVFN
ncbi:glycosyltransferase family 4 protein [Azospirillum sp. YIM DDC1]|uniref:Glycosyltransferase family 4 protein n=1 Tax=Azospirillum aestuarii TaxID=2802052 RepID=A0ABS1I735_9PROT|nr:glycosyltransferase family 1 protein [Azospirillum aestuarii]MBK4722835.1 glycosyltransferase family 4 protein [Azospirillum aestuarii]